VFTTPAASPAAEQALQALGVEVIRVAGSAGGLDLSAVLKHIAARGITRLMVEGGAKIAAAFVGADLVDEAALFRSPNTIGSDGVDALEGLPLVTLTNSPRLAMRGGESLGPDRLELFERI
jgi:diaminohydroxyphosphoribosylaminopyrimidine deaminase/5-amino-6-(5-phosphoribosylamino)uracil reductase